MTPEQEARRHIDEQLEAAGWVVQDYNDLYFGASLGVAVREFTLETGYADYLLFVGKKAVGVVEAKAEGTTLSGVAEQTLKYQTGLKEKVPHFELPLPFAYESTGVETYFRDIRDPDSCSRRVFSFHRPETLLTWVNEPPTLRARLRQLPQLIEEGLRECQIEAIKGLEQSFSKNKPRALIQMATGSGKTYTAVSSVYRLIKHAGAQRILFLVDRSNLGRQTEKEFQQYITPDDGRKFTELYNVQRLTSSTIDPVSKVCISTIQRAYSILRGKELEEDVEEESAYERDDAADKPMEVVYNPTVPIETFDFVVIDECHRSIYNLWRQVLEYFDCFLIGLTATPSKQTFGFFNQNLVMEYAHDRAVADGVNVSFDVYRIKTQVTEEGSTIDAGYSVIKKDKQTRRERIEQLDEDLEYEAVQLDRSVTSKSQIITVIRTFKEKLFKEIFPGRTTVPKTLIFAKDDNHAEEILHIVWHEFGKGNDFAKKITYKTTGAKPETLISEFRNSHDPRIAVSVDMIATGTDIKPLECLLFMRDVKSSVYFDQMKGRGTRVINPTDLQAVTPDASFKTHFVIVDAVGVTETDKTDTKPLERKHSVKFDTLIKDVAMGVRDEDVLSSLAGRLSKFDRKLDMAGRQEIAEATGGTSLKSLINDLLDAIDPDKQVEHARELFDTESPTEEQLTEATTDLTDRACELIENPEVRNKILEIKQRSEITIDEVSVDRVVYAGAAERKDDKDIASMQVQSFRDFIEKNKDEITALQIFYNQPYGKRHFTLKQIKELARAIEQPPYHLTPETLWQAYERLEHDNVRGVGEQRLLTDIITLVRHAMGEDEVLYPFRSTVDKRFYDWLSLQEREGRTFSADQLEWLEMIKETLTANLSIDLQDFQYAPFQARGGPLRAIKLFGRDELTTILDELNEAIAA